MITEKLDCQSKCIGCGTCARQCTFEAIKMVEDKQGYLSPQINSLICTDCGQCEKVCPQINYKVNNYENPNCYGIKANDDILEVSSSGGAFSVLCDYVFERGGYVCGAAYSDDFKSVHHIIITDKKDMHKLRGSKYVQSGLGNVFHEIKKLLEDGKYVLFSGTPCQVVALYNVLGMGWEKLITVDLLCSGVPSGKFLDKYISDVSNGKTIKSVNMRPKKYGWYEDGIQIIFDDESEYMVHGVRDPYIKGFLSMIMNYKACYDCQFAMWPRPADFTIGDLWHADQLFFKENFEKGISCITTNSDRANTIFENIVNKFAEVRNISLEFIKTHNMTIQKRRIPLSRDRFFNLLDEEMTFGNAVDYSVNWKFDVAITGCWSVPNYGGMLTYYALYLIVRKLGYKVIMVERRKNMPNYDIPKLNGVRKNLYPYYDVSRIHKTYEDQKELNKRVNNFILGSDQVWNYQLMDKEDISSYMFDYVESYRNKITYGTSFGSVKFTGNDDDKLQFKELISKINHVSTREESGKNILQQDFNTDSVCVLDPVLLCEKSEYEKLIENSCIYINNNDYVFTYFVLPDKSKYGFEDIAKKLNMDLVNTINLDSQYLKKLNLLNEWIYPYQSNVKLEDWLCYIKNSSYIITDSFHAVCLALVFHKNFIYIKGHATEETGLERITSLLSKVNLLDRIVDNAGQAMDIVSDLEDIDFNSVEETLEKYRNFSIDWLKNAIS